MKQFQVFKVEYLSFLLGITTNEFHRDIKPMILKEFRTELNKLSINNPDIGLDIDFHIYLSDPQDVTRFIATNVHLDSYKN